MSHLSSIINIILRIVNLCFSSGDFPASCKSAIISPLIKKTGLDSKILKNYRPVTNLSFISKIIEKTITTQIHSHLINNDIVDNFQSAYKTGHSCETALLRMYNDIVTTIQGSHRTSTLKFPDFSLTKYDFSLTKVRTK